MILEILRAIIILQTVPGEDRQSRMGPASFNCTYHREPLVVVPLRWLGHLRETGEPIY